MADPDLELGEGVGGLFFLPALPAFLPSVISFFFYPKWGGGGGGGWREAGLSPPLLTT